MYAKFHHNILHSSRDRAIFTFFRIWSSANPRPIKNVSSQSLGLDLVNINVYAKVYQNIPFSSRVNFHFFQNLNLGKTSTNHKCHLTISWATSCQYTNVYAKFHHNIPLSSSLGPFSLFQNLELGKTSTDEK